MRNIIDFLTLGLLHDKITQLCFYNTVCIDNKCDLFFDPYAERAINDFSIPKVSLIHDVIYFDHPVFRASSTGRWIENVSDSIIKFSGKIITVSDFSKQKIIKYHRVKEDLVKVIHIRPNIIKSDVSPDFTDSVLKKYELKKNNYLIYVSSFWPHKNHLRLLEAFSKFVSSSDSDVKLALVGTFDIEKNPDSYKSVLLEKGLYGRVVFTYQVSDQELKALLPNALAFVFPSIYEGFGIPAVEAMAAGVPLICSNTGSLPEIAGNAALFFDPYNTDEIAAAISEIVGNSDLRGKLIRLGYEQAKKFADPDVMVNEYIKVFEEVMK
ncbi:MAG: glycosyltransferase family 4 protein [Holosporaceae bacterium]|jgi:glycosyltransferase involved in cell wall biosynthesis|nr:glycosyltransferase family 4 protein [Holosporaceae bacterium]